MARKLTKRQREARRKKNSARTERYWQKLREKHDRHKQFWSRWSPFDNLSKETHP